MKYCLILLLLVFSLSAGLCAGELDILPPDEGDNVKANDIKGMAQEDAMREEAAQDEEKRVSLDLKGIDINELFKVLSAKSGITIVTTPEVKGMVTVFINNLTFDEALDVIVTMQDLAYDKKGNLVKVMTEA